MTKIYTSPVVYRIDPSVFSNRSYVIDRSPYEGDTLLIKKNKYVIQNGPDQKNHELYADLAAAFWRAGNNKAAKKMALCIERSRDSFYTGTLFHSAGNVYEYGSFTSNFKNEASLLLCKIGIEEKQYRQALDYLIKADKVYKIKYNCGTGHRWYMDELRNLYAVCYEGLGFTNKLIDLYFQSDFLNNEDCIAVLLKKFSLAERRRYLQLALDNITIVKDEWESLTYMASASGEPDSLTSRYTNGTGNTVLFHRKVTLPSVRLKNGETITRRHFTEAFTRSLFYRRLMGINEKEDSPGEESSL
ncbi:MAG: hypothetical protein NTW29_12800 [Bacteroidetes bacterium]|nr:hypothetical protein [Bacteroidota bacterium]